MLAAGPLADDSGELGGDGMVIIRADSLEEATKIAGQTMHSSGARNSSAMADEEGGFNLRVFFRRKAAD